MHHYLLCVCRTSAEKWMASVNDRIDGIFRMAEHRLSERMAPVPGS